MSSSEIDTTLSPPIPANIPSSIPTSSNSNSDTVVRRSSRNITQPSRLNYDQLGGTNAMFCEIRNMMTLFD